MTAHDLTPVTITCPECGHHQHSVAEHFRDALIYQCPGCAILLRPEHDDACILCSHGDGPCPLCQAPAPTGQLAIGGLLRRVNPGTAAAVSLPVRRPGGSSA